MPSLSRHAIEYNSPSQEGGENPRFGAGKNFGGG